MDCPFQGTVSSEEWEDRVQSDVTTSTYSTSSDSDLTENEIQAEFSEGSLSSKSINVNSGALAPESVERQGSSQHVINLLQPVCITRYHICFHGNRFSALQFEKLNLKLFKIKTVNKFFLICLFWTELSSILNVLKDVNSCWWRLLECFIF